MKRTRSRRQFLKVSGAATAAAVTLPTLLLPRRAAAAESLIVGDGAWKYECQHGWGELPADHTYGGPSHGVAFDAAGMVYIAHQGKPGSVFVFDPAGKFVRSLADFHQGAGHGIEIRKEGNEEFIYLAANGGGPNGGLAKLTLKGELVWRKNAPPESHQYDDGMGWNFTNISFTPDGGFHAGDGYGRHFIHRYDKDGNYLSTFGGHGKEPGKFNTPHGHWLDTRDGTPKLCVCDRANARLQYLTIDGQPLSILEGFLFPANIDIRGEIMLVPDLHARITLLDRNNQVLAQLGDDPEWRKVVLDGFKVRRDPKLWRPGRFVHPHDAAFDKDGNIIVAEWVEGGRVTRLRKVS